MTDEIMTMRLSIEGRVQGVGFREFVMQEADLRHLRGWVRNRSDGSVEALVSGPKADVEALIAACTRGPQGSEVKHIDLAPADPPDTLDFKWQPSV